MIPAHLSDNATLKRVSEGLWRSSRECERRNQLERSRLQAHLSSLSAEAQSTHREFSRQIQPVRLKLQKLQAKYGIGDLDESAAEKNSFSPDPQVSGRWKRALKSIPNYKTTLTGNKDIEKEKVEIPLPTPNQRLSSSKTGYSYAALYIPPLSKLPVSDQTGAGDELIKWTGFEDCDGLTENEKSILLSQVQKARAKSRIVKKNPLPFTLTANTMSSKLLARLMAGGDGGGEGEGEVETRAEQIRRECRERIARVKGRGFRMSDEMLLNSNSIETNSFVFMKQLQQCQYLRLPLDSKTGDFMPSILISDVEPLCRRKERLEKMQRNRGDVAFSHNLADTMYPGASTNVRSGSRRLMSDVAQKISLLLRRSPSPKKHMSRLKVPPFDTIDHHYPPYYCTNKQQGKNRRYSDGKQRRRAQAGTTAKSSTVKKPSGTRETMARISTLSTGGDDSGKCEENRMEK